MVVVWRRGIWVGRDCLRDREGGGDEEVEGGEEGLVKIRVGEEGEDIFEEDARGWEIRVLLQGGR